MATVHPRYLNDDIVRLIEGGEVTRTDFISKSEHIFSAVDGNCAICLSTLTDDSDDLAAPTTGVQVVLPDTPVRAAGCGHIFHSDCLKASLDRVRGAGGQPHECPLCRCRWHDHPQDVQQAKSMASMGAQIMGLELSPKYSSSLMKKKLTIHAPTLSEHVRLAAYTMLRSGTCPESETASERIVVGASLEMVETMDRVEIAGFQATQRIVLGTTTKAQAAVGGYTMELRAFGLHVISLALKMYALLQNTETV